MPPRRLAADAVQVLEGELVEVLVGQAALGQRLDVGGGFAYVAPGLARRQRRDGELVDPGGPPPLDHRPRAPPWALVPVPRRRVPPAASVGMESWSIPEARNASITSGSARKARALARRIRQLRMQAAADAQDRK